MALIHSTHSTHADRSGDADRVAARLVRHGLEIGAGFVIAVLTVGAILSMRLAAAGRTWPALDDALHAWVPLAF